MIAAILFALKIICAIILLAVSPIILICLVLVLCILAMLVFVVLPIGVWRWIKGLFTVKKTGNAITKK